MKRFSLGIGTLALLGLAALSTVLNADEYDRKTVITISQPMEVPGVVLPPGTYVMKLFNSSSNRHIVQFMNEDQNQQLALTFAVSAERIRPTGKSVLTMYEGSKDAPPALRTWFYPGDTVGQEFLYPHDQAVRISERTKTAVPEIETGKAVETAEAVKKNDSDDEARVESPLIARAEPAPVAEEAAPVPEPQQAVAEPESPPSQSQRAEAETSAAPVEIASTSSDTLPRTAGNGPLAALIGSVALALALGMRTMKRSRAL